MERDEARERLTRVRDEFAGSLATTREQLAESQADSTEVAPVAQHPADVATDTAQRELEVTQVAMFEARLAQIDAAFERLEHGTYGTCMVCGQPIPDERLALVPDTPYCVSDAQREQARQQ